MTHEILTINISSSIDGDVAVSSGDGSILFKEIDEALENGQKVTLDFDGIDMMTTTFLNAAIGQLYSKYDSDKIKESLKLASMDPSDKEILKIVVQRAKEYFRDKGDMESAIQESLDNE